MCENDEKQNISDEYWYFYFAFLRLRIYLLMQILGAFSQFRYFSLRYKSYGFLHASGVAT